MIDREKLLELLENEIAELETSTIGNLANKILALEQKPDIVIKEGECSYNGDEYAVIGKKRINMNDVMNCFVGKKVRIEIYEIKE